MSDLDDYVRPDAVVLTTLEAMVGQLTDEVSQWRHRALKAEAGLKAAKGKGKEPAGPDLLEARERVVDLEVENQTLRHRIEAAKSKLQAISGRVAFLERAAEDGQA